jgi:voltage-gated potassium channel
MPNWEKRTEWPLAIAAIVFLAAYAWPILQPDLAHGLVVLCRMLTWTVWGLFVVDYVVRLAQAEHRRRWFVRHLLDLVIIALPLLRPLRLLRLIVLLRALNRTAASGLRGRVAIYVAGGSLLLAFVAALAVLDAERGHEGANISDFQDAIWWAFTTMTTVGYGDRFPVTENGRLVGVLLMVGGIAVLGTVTATFASWLVQAVEDEGKREASEIDGLRAEIARLADVVEARRDES